MRCLEENTLFDYLCRRLDDRDRDAVVAHAATCSACRQLIAAAAGDLPSTRELAQATAATAPGELPTPSAVPGFSERLVPGSTADVPAGLLAGKYRRLRLLGAGGMGTVHEAVNTWTGRRVAVKELHGDASELAGAVQRFALEAQSASRIAHPNVVDVLDLGEDPATGALFIVQELLTGMTLRAYLAAHGPLAVEDALRIIGPAIAGLTAAHDAGVVHRDLKPENIFLARDAGGHEVVKLIDFGLSKRPREPADLGLTERGRQLGTPYYMSPEQLRGEVDLDERADVWSIGVVLFEMVAGRRPFAGPSYHDLIVQILKEPVPRLDDMRPGAPGALAALIARTLERARDDRPSARALSDALDELRRRPDVMRLPAGNPYRGILPFEATDRGVYFGRAVEVGAVVERALRAPFVLVAGDSGVGKSSLVRAGVLPALGDLAIRVVTVTPGRRPLAALAAALAPVIGDDAAAVAEALATAPATVAERISRALAGPAAGAAPAHDAPQRMVVFVDQLEELVTLAEPAQAAATATALAALLSVAPAIHAIATARSDFLARLSALPGLGDAVTGALYLLRPLARHAVRDAILGPARLTGVRFESPALVDELVAATEATGGTLELPLLQFALAELWAARDVERGVIRADSLRALGGVAGALARHADGVIADLPARAREVARRVLTALVSDAGTRARRTAGELGAAAGASDDGEAGAAVLEALVRGRLITIEDAGPGAPPTYQIAHDALLEGWDTLRGWRGREVERGAARQRLQRAAADWDRLGRPGDGLWGDRQLREVGELSGHALPALEAAFLERSQRAVQRRRRQRYAAVLGAATAIALGFAGARWSAHRALAAEIATRLAGAETALVAARGGERTAIALRGEAFAAFDRGDSAAGEASWAQVLEREVAVDASYREAGEHLEAALARDGGDPEVRRRFAGLLHDRARLAERRHRTLDRDELARRMLTYDDGTQRARWSAPARLAIASAPAGAAVIAQRFDDAGGRRRAGAAIALGVAPVLAHELAAGSYLVTLRLADRPEVRAAVLLARGEQLDVTIPIPRDIPAGYVYVPPGRFLYGSSDTEEVRRTFAAQPLHPTATEGYLIARHELTFGDWIEFLRALPADERRRRLPSTLPTASVHVGAYVDLSEPAPGQFRLALQPTVQRYVVEGDQAIHYDERTTAIEQRWLRLPVSGISWDDAVAYADWLARSGRLPGARPCADREWERAARGADDRLYPHGDRIAPEDADLSDTYGHKPAAYGPDEVGSHPASDSPFGVADLAGNVWEWVRSASGDEQVVIRGGSWYHNPIDLRSTNREPSEPSLRSLVIGARICAPVSREPDAR